MNTPEAHSQIWLGNKSVYDKLLSMEKYSNPVIKQVLSREELQSLELFNYQGRYELIDDPARIPNAVKELKKACVLGFDTETRPSFRVGEFYHVSLLQLATHDCCFLFRLNKIPLQKEILDILEDESIIKVGVAIHDDLKALQKRTPFKPAGFLDLAERTKISKSITLSLRSLCGMYLNRRLSKGSKVTNWDSPVLSESQIRYAANDAFVSLAIFEKMFLPDVK